MARRLGLTGGFLFAALAATVAVGCGDDEDGSNGNAAGSGNEAGEGGSGGKAGSGGTGGKAGSGGTGGADAVSGAGGEPGPGAGGHAGGGGEGGEPVFEEITQVSDVVCADSKGGAGTGLR